MPPGLSDPNRIILICNAFLQYLTLKICSYKRTHMQLLLEPTGLFSTNILQE